MPCIGKRKMRKSSPLLSSEYPTSFFLCYTILCINHIMYSSTCTNSNVPHLLIRIENPAMHPSSTIGPRFLFSHNKPQSMYPTPPPTLESSRYYRLPVVACSVPMIRRGCVLAAEFLLRAILVVLLPQTNGLENDLLIKLHVRRPHTTFVACRFMEHSKS